MESNPWLKYSSVLIVSVFNTGSMWLSNSMTYIPLALYFRTPPTMTRFPRRMQEASFSSHPATMTQDHQAIATFTFFDLFFKLPPELRVHIYELILVRDNSLSWQGETLGIIPLGHQCSIFNCNCWLYDTNGQIYNAWQLNITSFPFTCRQLYNECLPVGSLLPIWLLMFVITSYCTLSLGSIYSNISCHILRN